MANQNNINQDSMLRKGTVLRGTYRIDGHLSSGSFGNTYVASHIYLNEKYAIKEFFMNGVTQRAADTNCVEVSNHANHDEFNQQLEKFKKEARRLRGLHDDHIVRVHDLFEENGTAYYVMDYIDGEDLRKRLERIQHPLSESEVDTILDQTLSALSKVHDQGIWHLDLKPANIMVDSKGCVKLVDFGASKQSENKKGDASSTAVAFTNGYAPIEQMERSSDKFGPWTDFYALGATLYNLLTNKKPPMPSDINNDHTPDKRSALSLPSEVSHKMRDLILWLMKPNHKERPRSVKEIRDHIGLDSVRPQATEDSEETLLPHATTIASSAKNRFHSTWKLLLGLLTGVLLSTICFFCFYSHFIHDKVNRMPVPNGTYTGSIIRGTSIRDGEGYFVNKDDERYEGTWEKDKLVYGTRINSISEYTGQFDEELRNHGFGIIKYSDEYISNKSNRGLQDSTIIVSYIGNWYKDKKHGLGRAIKKDGSMEFGEYKDGIFQPTTGASYKVGEKVYGIDVSRHQADIDWDNLALYCDANGNVRNVDNENKKYMQPVFFVYLKATEGDSLKDRTYKNRKMEAQNHRIVSGAYHYFRLGIDVNAQVKNFLETATWSEGDLPPALDVEDEDDIRKYGVDKLQETVLYWLEAIEEKMGVRPIIYTRDFILNEYLDSPKFKEYKFWIARYGNSPSYSDWQFWQKSDAVRMKGHNGPIDVNQFAGNYDAFKSYIDDLGNKAQKH